MLGDLLDAPDTDSVLITGYFGGYGEYSAALAAAEIETAAEMGELVRDRCKPVAIHTMYPYSDAAEELQRRGVPVFRAIEEAARSLGCWPGAPPPTPRCAPCPTRHSPWRMTAIGAHAS
ncbi:hypothetical protein [Streptomyces melanosporofaciens]|uniref:hypothetical protein n=1 Tax=Streptomyces melanosporofaciens TaxID=67327 RepID=UPI000B888E74|nr:hypothetical protein [Streptomyces melanosporofaciens]